MTVKLRNLRLFPFLLLICLLLLFAFDVKERRASGNLPGAGTSAPPLPAAESAVPGPVLLEFSAATLDASQPGWPAADRFGLSPDKREQRVACRVRYRLRENVHTRFLFAWYNENTLFQAETLAPPVTEGTLSSVIAIPRGGAGHWSVDLSLDDETLLRTLDFDTRAHGSAPALYRSEHRNTEP
ncbi:MAG: hypothetical protein V1913_17700 [Fibrobacterota bacterium]